MRRLGDEHAVGNRCHCARQDEAAGKLSTLIHASVAVCVFERGDRPDRRVFSDTVDIRHVSARSEERRVGKEGRSWRAPQEYSKNGRELKTVGVMPVDEE